MTLETASPLHLTRILGTAAHLLAIAPSLYNAWTISDAESNALAIIGSYTGDEEKNRSLFDRLSALEHGTIDRQRILYLHVYGKDPQDPSGRYLKYGLIEDAILPFTRERGIPLVDVLIRKESSWEHQFYMNSGFRIQKSDGSLVHLERAVNEKKQ